MVRNQWNVDGQREPLSGEQEQQVKQHVQRILGQHQLQREYQPKSSMSQYASGTAEPYRIERVALIDRIFVVRLQLVERNHVEY